MPYLFHLEDSMQTNQTPPSSQMEICQYLDLLLHLTSRYCILYLRLFQPDRFDRIRGIFLWLQKLSPAYDDA
ncbi:hypothetical protein BJX99DRAFT_239878 [Aspergillus californicus]